MLIAAAHPILGERILICMSISELSRSLNLPRQSVSRWVKEGCPLDEDSAQSWIAQIKTKQRQPKQIEYYATADIFGTDTEARFLRLKQNGESVSKQIAGFEKRVIPNLISDLSSANTAVKKKEISKQLFQANSALLVLRKEFRATLKQVTEIEFKRAALNRDGYLVSLSKRRLKNFTRYLWSSTFELKIRNLKHF